jgi:hypothetical protein
MFAPSEPEADLLVAEVEEDVSRAESAPVPDLDAARGRFMDRISQLQRGEDPAPALEEFIPAVLVAARPILSAALNIVGRERVTKFLAGKIGSFIQPYVGQEGSHALAQALASAGLRLIAGETSESESGLASATLATTTEDTVRRLADLPEEAFDDATRLESELTRSFYEAAASNFPPQLLRPDLPQLETSLEATWVPRPHRRYRYKKYSRIFDVTITPQIAAALKTFGGDSLDAVLRDQLGVSFPVRARLHLYEVIPGTWLGQVASADRSAGGLGSRGSAGWRNMHPLTPETAGLLLQQPGLGAAVAPQYLASRHRVTPGQRLFYMEIPGGRPRIVATSAGLRPARTSQLNITVDLRASSREVRLGVYLSEREAQSLLPLLRAREVSRMLAALQPIIKAGIGTAMTGGLRRHVRIISDEVPLDQFSFSSILGKVSGEFLRPVSRALLESANSVLIGYLKTKPDELIAAIEAPEDGVTLVVTLPGSPVAAAIQAVAKGQLPNFRQLAGLTKGVVTGAQARTVAGFVR